MAKPRVHELAREFGVESKAILEVLKARGEFVKSASSTVEPSVAMMIRDEFGAGRVPAEQDAAPSPVIAFDEIEEDLAGSPYSLPSEQREYVEQPFSPLQLHCKVGRPAPGADLGNRSSRAPANQPHVRDLLEQ